MPEPRGLAGKSSFEEKQIEQFSNK